MKDILLKWMDQADLSGEPVPGMPLVEIAGDKRVLIENHRGVTQYSGQQIGVRVEYGTLQIHGCGLELRQMTKDRLVIAGRIDDITLCRRIKG